MKYEMNNFYLADCLDAMKEIPDNFFELAIVDPPYGIGNFVQTSGNVRGTAVEWNNSTPPAEYFIELKILQKAIK
jgi:site-specific DNA-methyltransferase (adenine-specific)